MKVVVKKIKGAMYWDEAKLLPYIIKYIETKDENIYNDYLYIPLHKLVENIVNTFHCTYLYQNNSYTDLHNDCMSFILTNILPAFDSKLNTKFYSYCTVCLKNFLINKNQKAYKNNCRSISLDEHHNSNGYNDDDDTLLNYEGLSYNNQVNNNVEIGRKKAEEKINQFIEFIEKNKSSPSSSSNTKNNCDKLLLFLKNWEEITDNCIKPTKKCNQRNKIFNEIRKMADGVDDANGDKFVYFFKRIRKAFQKTKSYPPIPPLTKPKKIILTEKALKLINEKRC